MSMLAWDDALGRLAQRRAETCNIVHDCTNCRTPLNQRSILAGQNALYASTWFGSQTPDWGNLISIQLLFHVSILLKRCYFSKKRLRDGRLDK